MCATTNARLPRWSHPSPGNVVERAVHRLLVFRLFHALLTCAYTLASWSLVDAAVLMMRSLVLFDIALCVAFAQATPYERKCRSRKSYA
jgi:hypothetical protein